METKQIDDLKPNPKNPRELSKHDYESLYKSIQQFGDLSGIVFNIHTQQLVGGHQRIEAFKRMQGDKKIIITERYESPNQVGTVAIGYVTWNNEMFGYREVDWPIQRELAANIAANRIQGNFDQELLAQINLEIAEAEGGSDLLALTGQTQNEIDDLMRLSSAPEEDDSTYSRKIEAPTYEPKNEKPQAASLFDIEKTKQLIAEIQAADISDEDKEFLTQAAYRHTVFNYESIADYYANSDPAVQDLMEKSALVIIDFEKAIENGFVSLTDMIEKLRTAEDISTANEA